MFNVMKMKSHNVIMAFLLIGFIFSCKSTKINSKNKKDKDYKTYNLKDTIKIVLSQNYLGGYEWEFEPNQKVALLNTIDSLSVSKDSLFTENARIFKFSALKTGAINLSFNKKRSFEPDSLKLKNFYSEEIKVLKNSKQKH